MRQRLIENTFVAKVDLSPLPIQEGVLTESNGKKYKCVAAYRVPISRFNYKNSNGRIYPRELWEKVINNQKHIWEGCVGLADHPSENEEGSVKNIFGVWNNLTLKDFPSKPEGIVEADLYLVGPYGRLAQEVIEAGGKLGFSSSGLGDLKEDKITVDPDSYILERVSDWVLSPSQGVFGTLEMQIKEKIQKADEEASQELLEEKKENSPLDSHMNTSFDLSSHSYKMAQEKEKRMPENKYSKLEERKFRKDVEAFLNEANNIKDPLKRKQELLEILSYFTEGRAPDLKQKVEEYINQTEQDIQHALNQHQALEETFGVAEVEKLKDGVKKVALDAEFYERQVIDYKKIIEGLQNKIKDLQAELAIRPTMEAYENILSHTKLLQEQIQKRKYLLASQTKKAKELLQQERLIQKQLMRELHNSHKEFQVLKEIKEGLETQIKKYRETISKYEAIAEKARALRQEKIEKEKKLDFTPKTSIKESVFRNFSESDKIEQYYQDLVERHGEDIKKFEQKFKACKTLFEATRLYTSLLPEIETVRVLEAGDPELRKQFTEATTGRVIRKSLELKLPPGWE